MKAYKQLTLFLLMLFAVKANAQLLIKPSKEVLTPRIQAVLKTRKAVVQYEAITIDRAKLSDSIVQFQFLNEPIITLKKRRVDERGSKSFSWFGKNADNSASIILTVLDDDIQGIITKLSSIYRIETIDGQYIVTKINQSLYPHESCSNDAKESMNNPDNSVPKNVQPEDEFQKSSKRSSYPLQTPGNFICKLRILIMYTGAAASSTSNITNTAQLAIDEFNQSLYNSNVIYEVELAGIVGTDFIEGESLKKDKVAFAKNGDGQMDNIHTYREIYAADVCVLMENSTAECGSARAIKACFESAFCVVDIDCATGQYTFAHEVSHLLGCRHNIADDPAEDPYIYGHGYRYEDYAHQDSSYRTIMAYDCESGCTRLQYFSNPTIFYQGRPLGSALFSKNYLVLNNNLPHYMSYRPSIPTRIVNSSDVAPAADMVFAMNKIETSGTVSIASSQYYYFIAGNEIELLPGFEANEGNTFIAEIQNTNCALPPLTDSCDYSKSTGDSLGDLSDNLLSLIQSDFAVYPNPTKDKITIASKFAQENVDMVFTNMLGATIKTIHQDRFKAVSKFDIDINDWEAGIYFVVIKSNNKGIFVYKLIKQ